MEGAIVTVADLIEKLQRLPGDSTLRRVEIKVTVHRPYKAETVMDGCDVHSVDLERTVAVIHAFGGLD